MATNNNIFHIKKKLKNLCLLNAKNAMIISKRSNMLSSKIIKLNQYLKH